ncbi:MAG: hypothetical protein WCH98_08725 [Verrucomicrobiota bacterium]
MKIFNDPSDGVSRKKFRGGLGISGFSLIEIALALGIIAFAGTAILGLLPTALNSMQAASFDMVAVRIASDVRADLQQTGLSGSGKAVVYYSADGQEVSPADGAGVYSAYRSESSCQMPGSSAAGLHRVAVQIVYNPARTSLTANADGWATIPATMSFKTLRFYVAR